MQRRGSAGAQAVLGLVLALLAGLLVGVLGTFKHRVGVSAANGAGLPIGLVTALAAVVALLIALRLSFPSRLPVAVTAAGIAAGALVLLLPGASGQDQVVLLDRVGIAWLVGVVLAAVAVPAWPRRRGPQPDAGILEAGRDAVGEEDRST